MSQRLSPIIGTNDILAEYVEAVAHEVINDQETYGFPGVGGVGLGYPPQLTGGYPGYRGYHHGFPRYPGFPKRIDEDPKENQQQQDRQDRLPDTDVITGVPSFYFLR